MTTEQDAKEKTAEDAVPETEEAHDKVADLALRGEAPSPVTDEPERELTGEA